MPTLDVLLARIARRPPDSVLVTADDVRMTVGEFVTRVDTVAGALRARGLAPGQRVGVMHPNTADAVVAWFATWDAGGAVVPLNPRLAPAEIERLAGSTAVAMVLAAPGTVSSAPLGVAVVVHSGDEVDQERGEPGPLGRGDDEVDDEADDDSRIALVQFTSGTTGPPRPVPLRHDTIMAMLDSVLGEIGGQPADPDRAPMPNLIPISLSLWAGIYNVLFAFCVGAPVVVMPTFDPVTFAALVRAHGIRSVVLPPAAMVMCTDAAEVTSLEPLRYVRSITAPLSPTEAIRFHDKFDVAILNCYGQTELGGEVIGWTGADWKAFGVQKIGAVGRPHREVEVRLVGDDGAVCAGIDAVGELEVRTPSTHNDAALLDAERSGGEGFVKTGDLARIDEDGFVWIVGRRSSMINRGGLKVAPGDIEEVLRTVDDVVDVAVVGAPDRRLGEVPWAFVVWREGAAREFGPLADRCRERLAPYKVPAGWTSVDALPRNEIGKIVPQALTDLLRDEEGAQWPRES